MDSPRAGKALSIRLEVSVRISAAVTGLTTFVADFFASRQVALLGRTDVGKGAFLARRGLARLW